LAASEKDMKYKMLLGLGLILVTSCGTVNDDNIVTGDLYFSPFRFGTYYNLPDSIIKKMEDDFNAVNLHSANAKADSALIELVLYYSKLKDEGLIYKPFVDIRVNDDLMVKLVLDSADYEKIKTYKYQELVDENKKIKIRALASKRGLGFYYCTDLLEVKLVDGKTLWQDNRLKIQDYR
jgi:hypothetical protein